jgi:hypothetical protein
MKKELKGQQWIHSQTSNRPLEAFEGKIRCVRYVVAYTIEIVPFKT